MHNLRLIPNTATIHNSDPHRSTVPDSPCGSNNGYQISLFVLVVLLVVWLNKPETSCGRNGLAKLTDVTEDRSAD